MPPPPEQPETTKINPQVDAFIREVEQVSGNISPKESQDLRRKMQQVYDTYGPSESAKPATRGKLKWFYYHEDKMIPVEDEAAAKAANRVLGAPIYHARSADEARRLHEQGK